MMQVHRDMICSECNSVNEHEQITKEKTGNTTEMIIRCKCCGHEYIQGFISHWTDDGQPTANFKLKEWTVITQEIY